MKVLIVFIHAAIVSAWSASASTVYALQNGTNLHYRNVTNGYVVSPGFANSTSYPEDFQGSVTLIAWPPNNYIRLYFEDVDLDVSNYCSADSLEVWHGRFVPSKMAFILCGWHRPRPWISVDNSVKLVFKSDFMQAGRGFRIRYEATPISGLCDTKTEYQCKDRECIPASKRCDGIMDCKDASDEKLCPNGPVKEQASNAEVPCGTPVHRPVTEPEDRLVGGQEAVPHSWPWQVSLNHVQFEVLGHFCGGSLISPKWVLTAAHCMRRKKARDVFVALGMHNRLNITNVITRGVRTAVSHPKFSKSHRNYDVALLELDAPVDFTDGVRPVCLPAGNGSDLLARGQCFVTGWGQTRGSGHFDELKQTEMTQLPFKNCLRRNMGTGAPEEQYTFCAGDRYGENGICSGDSGGPLVCSKSNGTSWTIMGVANSAVMTNGLRALCGAGSDSFWNRVAFHTPWIKRTMRVL